jgi:hypothetical protein
MNHLSENWEAVDFPLIKNSRHNWHHRNATLSGLKALFFRENLKMYEDYVMIVNPEHKDHRLITVKFKEEGQGLICLLQWVGSNYYKETK